MGGGGGIKSFQNAMGKEIGMKKKPNKERGQTKIESLWEKQGGYSDSGRENVPSPKPGATGKEGPKGGRGAEKTILTKRKKKNRSRETRRG